jgi:hypothetical protein
MRPIISCKLLASSNISHGRISLMTSRVAPSVTVTIILPEEDEEENRDVHMNGALVRRMEVTPSAKHQRYARFIDMEKREEKLLNE